MKRRFSKVEYEEYLKSSQWQTKRRRKAQEQNHTCEICKKKVTVGYHIHHKNYKRFKKERLSDLMFLCEDCHTNIHSKANKGKRKGNTYMETFKCQSCGGDVFVIKQKLRFLRVRRAAFCAKCGKFYAYLKN